MNTPGNQYKNSNKVNAVMILPGLLVALVIAFGSGWLYGLVSKVNPLIYINFIVLFICAILGVTIAGYSFRAISKSRNVFITSAGILVSGLAAWYASWSYYFASEAGVSIFKVMAHPGYVMEYIAQYSSTHSMSYSKSFGKGVEMPGAVMLIFYVVELGAFIAPVFLLKSLFGNHYFCEACQKANENKEYYAKKPADLNRYVEEAKNGNLGFMGQLELFPSYKVIQPAPDLKNGERIVHLTVSNCPNCGNNAIVDIYTHTVSQDKKGNAELKDKEHLVKRIFFNPLSIKAKEKTVA